VSSTTCGRRRWISVSIEGCESPVGLGGGEDVGGAEDR
jgi:hypothetical protein